MRIVINAFILCMTLFFVGCSTMESHAVKKNKSLYPYIGTKYAIESFYKSFDNYKYYGQPYIASIDIPLCIAADTILLPYDLFQYLTNLMPRHQKEGEIIVSVE